MNKAKKLLKLVELSQVEDSGISEGIEAYSLIRLVDGDLSHIGEAILQGLTVSDNCGKIKNNFFILPPTDYTIAPQTEWIEGVGGRYEYPKPLDYMLDSEACFSFNFSACFLVGYENIHPLKQRRLHATKENAEAHRVAIIKAMGGEV